MARVTVTKGSNGSLALSLLSSLTSHWGKRYNSVKKTLYCLTVSFSCNETYLSLRESTVKNTLGIVNSPFNKFSGFQRSKNTIF